MYFMIYDLFLGLGLTVHDTDSQVMICARYNTYVFSRHRIWEWSEASVLGPIILRWLTPKIKTKKQRDIFYQQMLKHERRLKEINKYIEITETTFVLISPHTQMLYILHELQKYL